MAPDEQPLSWISFAAAIVQTLAAVIQIAQGRGRPGRGGTGVSTGVRFGLAALVLEFGGWLVVRNLENGLAAVRLAVFAPAVLLGVVAFLTCIADLLRTPEVSEPPRPVNWPLSGDSKAAEAEAGRRKRQYERELEDARMSGVQVLSLVLGAAGGLAVVYTALALAGVLG